MLRVYQSWKFAAGWPFHFEHMHSFPLCCLLFPSQAWHNRKSSMIVLLNQWLHCAGPVPFHQHAEGLAELGMGHRSLCSQASVTQKLRRFSSAATGERKHERCVLNSECCRNKETARWFLERKRKASTEWILQWYFPVFVTRLWWIMKMKRLYI